jgi:hypothetical protein
VSAPEKQMAKMKPGHRLLHGISAALLIFLAIIGHRLLNQPDAAHIMLFAVLAFAVLRVVYELSFNPKIVPTLASTWAEQKKTLDLLKADFAASDGHPYTIIDLGSGRGEMTRRLARALPQARIIGIEWAYFPYLRSVLLAKLLRLKVTYRRADFLAEDCSQADAVLLYLNGPIAQTVGEKLHKELKPGTLVIANSFPLLGAWQPAETISFPAPFGTQLLVYRR